MAAFALMFGLFNGTALANDASSGSFTLGESLKIFHTGTLSAATILVISILFIGGIALTWTGFTKLKEASDSNGMQVKYSEGFMRLAGGAFLVSVVSVLSISWATLGNEGGSWHIGTIIEPATPEGLESADLIAMAANFTINAAGPLSVLILGFSVLIGITLIGTSLFAFAKISSGQSRESFTGVSARFIVGVLLTNVFWVIEILSASFGFVNPFQWVGGDDFSQLGAAAKKSLLAYSGEEGTTILGHAQHVMTIAFMGLVPFGLIAFVRGLLIVKDAVEATRQASMGMGFVHIIGGVALVNAKTFSCAVTTTFVGSGVAWCN